MDLPRARMGTVSVSTAARWRPKKWAVTLSLPAPERVKELPSLSFFQSVLPLHQLRTEKSDFGTQTASAGARLRNSTSVSGIPEKILVFSCPGVNCPNTKTSTDTYQR